MSTKRRLLTPERVWDLNMMRNDLLTFSKMIAECGDDVTRKAALLDTIAVFLPGYAERINDVLYGENDHA